MAKFNGRATAVTEAGDARVDFHLRQVPNGRRDPHWAGTMTIRSVDVWKAIAQNPRFRLRLSDGWEGLFDATEGAGMPPSDARPTMIWITLVDGNPFARDPNAVDAQPVNVSGEPRG